MSRRAANRRIRSGLALLASASLSLAMWIAITLPFWADLS